MRGTLLIALICLSACSGRSTSESGASEAAVANQAAALQNAADANVNAAIARIEADAPAPLPADEKSPAKK
jgi:uncharacterized lipoprotein YajG